MHWPTARDWLFSFKAFFASMLALYIAFALGLPRPYWAMAAVYVVSHPLTGATRSKALYRVLGTILGASAAVVLVPALVDAPVLLAAAIGAWTGTLLYVSLLDRTPRAYVFMLAAYTLPMIALPAVNAPQNVFDIASARTQEILVGILSASVVAGLIFPGKVAPVISARTAAWLRDAASWAADTLTPVADHRVHPASRHRLAADILAFDQLISQLAYDPDTADTVNYARALRGRMSMLLPVLSSMSGMMQELRANNQALPQGIDTLMHDVTQWILSPASRPEDGERLKEEVARLGQTIVHTSEWRSALGRTMRSRVGTLIELWQDCLHLQQLLSGQENVKPWVPVYTRRDVMGGARHYDHGIMLFSAINASVSIFAGCMIWIGMGWEDGAGAVTLGAVASCFFAAMDEPAPFIRLFFVWTIVSIALSAVMLFAIIPASHDFATLVALLAVPFLIIGTLIPLPRFNMIAMLLSVNTATFLGLQGAYDANFTAFFNGNLAGAAGALFALVWTLVTRPFGVQLATHRLVHASWRDLANTAAGEDARDYARLSSRMLDRLGQLVPRLAASGDDSYSDGFTELRVGYSALELQRDELELSDLDRHSINEVLGGVAGHYQARIENSRHKLAPETLRARIDDAMSLVIGRADHASREALHALVELRVSLFPGAPGYQQVPAF
ncbi:FUSC family protein [Silvimonas amylolytica]|uniref:Fusaric acid resistance protein n=1 Tax=Silvimonas amylolytica TaxID=449663 RepID=A0ABQ2PMV4_9NEIS|nr:FUSC family protein [Silvimonas amylolytica]GGP26641.1 fusaric acid resistance protein [Silvimonas amylolytica]